MKAGHGRVPNQTLMSLWHLEANYTNLGNCVAEAKQFVKENLAKSISMSWYITIQITEKVFKRFANVN